MLTMHEPCKTTTRHIKQAMTFQKPVLEPFQKRVRYRWKVSEYRLRVFFAHNSSQPDNILFFYILPYYSWLPSCLVDYITLDLEASWPRYLKVHLQVGVIIPLHHNLLFIINSPTTPDCWALLLTVALDPEASWPRYFQVHLQVGLIPVLYYYTISLLLQAAKLYYYCEENKAKRREWWYNVNT